AVISLMRRNSIEQIPDTRYEIKTFNFEIYSGLSFPASFILYPASCILHPAPCNLYPPSLTYFPRISLTCIRKYST
ncbi:MAG: hypothetical protein KBF74_11085, partial [Ferruginibacter sp.]|nr:hypothetical protein [Ferruginibacter sp.]